MTRALHQKRKEALLKRVQSDMNPTPARTFLFLVFIQLFSGALVLIFCPQFGISLSNHQISIVPHFLLHAESQYYCDVFCGGLFVSLTGLAAFFFSRPGMKRSLLKHQFSFVLALSLLFGFGFNLFGESTTWLSLFAWSLGSLSVLLFQFTVAKYFILQPSKAIAN